MELSDNRVYHMNPTDGWHREMQKIFWTKQHREHRYPKGRKGYNGRVERSHRTDDEEFYVPLLGQITVSASWQMETGNELLAHNRNQQ